MLHRVSDKVEDSEFERIEQLLLSRWPESKIGPGRGRMEHLMSLLGEPQRSIASIHVTGTNGKTSTSRMIETLLRAFGLTTGLFTSPHLHHITERIRLNGEPVSRRRFVEAYEELIGLIEMVDEKSLGEEGPRMTFFEAMTGLAYGIFCDAPVDVMVIEVGIGGTNDATNVIEPAVAVITPIDYDHVDVLGPTLGEIGANKAGIIDSGSVAVSSAQADEAALEIMRRCAEVDGVPVREGMEFELLERRTAVGGQLLTIRGMFGVYDEIFLPLYGAHQAQNAAVALAAIEAFLGGGIDGERGGLDIDVVREGFAAVTSPGRMEIVAREPLVIVDAAHNPAGAATLREGLAEAFALDHIIGVVSVLGDKDAPGLISQLVGVLDEVIVTQNSSHRAMPAHELAEVVLSYFPANVVSVEPNFKEATRTGRMRALAIHQDDSTRKVALLATGSVVTAAQARAALGVVEDLL
jgi:dihydrofolate synthase/folylpolyglutamate synthase